MPGLLALNCWESLLQYSEFQPRQDIGHVRPAPGGRNKALGLEDGDLGPCTGCSLQPCWGTACHTDGFQGRSMPWVSTCVAVSVPVGASCSDCQVPLTTVSNVICSVYDIFFLDEPCRKEVGGRFCPGSW